MGERAGSGVDKIMTAWEEQNWEKPVYDISLRAERVTLQLKVGQIVYIPGAADLRKEGKKEIPVEVSLNDREQILIEYLKVYGTINMKKATELCGYKARSATRKLINKMEQKQVIRKIGDGPNTRYELINGLN